MSINGKDIVFIFKNGIKIHNKILVDVKWRTSTDKYLDEKVWGSSLYLLKLFKNKKSWTEEEILSLSKEIFNYKSLLTTAFPKEKWLQSNFEALDTIPEIIKMLGPLKFFSAETYEPLHREVKKSTHYCNQSDLQKNCMFTLQKKIQVRLSNMSVKQIQTANWSMVNPSIVMGINSKDILIFK